MFVVLDIWHGVDHKEVGWGFGKIFGAKNVGTTISMVVGGHIAILVSVKSWSLTMKKAHW